MEFTRTRTPTIMDGIVIRYRLDGTGHAHQPEISASRNGVTIAGAWPQITDETVWAQAQVTMMRAWEDFRVLARGGDPDEERARRHEAHSHVEVPHVVLPVGESSDVALDAAEAQTPFTMPDRIAIDARGYGWRVWDDQAEWSMVPTNPDNSPVPEPVTWFVPEAGRD